MKIAMFLAPLIIFGASMSARAAVIEIGQDSRLMLGRGVDTLTEQPFDECITYDPDPKFQDGSGQIPAGDFSAVGAPVKVEHITSYEQMSKYSSTSVSAGVSYAFISGSFSHSDNEGSTMFSDQASVGIDMSADYGRYFLTNVNIKPEYAKLPRQEFYKRCGREFVVGYRLGQGLRIKMSVSASAASSFSQVSNAVSLAVQYGAVGAGVGAAFSNAASNLMTASALEVNLLAYGAGPLNSLSTVIATENDAVKFRGLIANYVQQLKPSYAVKTHYITIPYYPEDATYDPMLTEVKKQTVRSLYTDFLMLMDHKNRLDSALRGGRLNTYLGGVCAKSQNQCETYIQKMTSLQSTINNTLASMDDASKACIDADKISECKTMPEVHLIIDELETITWPARFRYELMQAYLDEIRRR